MTQEEKAKAYDEALERAKSFQQKYGGDYAGYIFPELRESEDERIRKELINYILYKAKGVSEEQEHSWVVYLEKQKEQKPVDNEEAEITDFERSVYDLCPVLGIEEAKATASDLLELAKKTLLKTGKVVLASNYPEGCSFEDGFHLGYNEGFNAKKKEQNPTNSEKSKEWSEEQMLNGAVEGRIGAIGFHNAIYIKEPEWTDMLDKYADGDKVLVIVLPKEEPNNG